jgi:hypothetical protein
MLNRGSPEGPKPHCNCPSQPPRGSEPNPRDLPDPLLLVAALSAPRGHSGQPARRRTAGLRRPQRAASTQALRRGGLSRTAGSLGTPSHDTQPPYGPPTAPLLSGPRNCAIVSHPSAGARNDRKLSLQRTPWPHAAIKPLGHNSACKGWAGGVSRLASAVVHRLPATPCENDMKEARTLLECTRTWLLSVAMLILLPGCAIRFAPPSQAHPFGRVIRTPPPPGTLYDRTMYLVITSEPENVDVFSLDVRGEGSSRQVSPGKKVGTTPFRIPITLCEWNEDIWFKNSVLGDGDRPWSPATGDSRHRIRFFLVKDGHYGLYVNTYLKYADLPARRILLGAGSEPATEEVHLALYGCPIELTEHGRQFSERFASAIDRNDYFLAEELRLDRMRALQDRIQGGSASWGAFVMGYGEFLGNTTQKLVASELEHLTHTVGLLDPQLMAFRRQLVTTLADGDTEAALALAVAVATMEERYLPEPQPAVLAQSAEQPQWRQRQDPVALTVQRKPYYGATNIVQALSAMRGSKVSPDVYQKALGGAQMLDILGFASMLNR